MPAIHNRKSLEPFRKNLRNNSTSAEATLWKYLKGSQLGKKIRRQHSAGNYILDFYCATERIAIELDGKNHFTDEGMKYDEMRTRYLNSLNIKVLRFENVRVFRDLDKVLEEIKASLTTLIPTKCRDRSLLKQEGMKMNRRNSQ
jgi:very-short-patch-repair endonuclease